MSGDFYIVRVFPLFFFCNGYFSGTEEQRDTPYARKRNYCIYDSAGESRTAAEYPRDDVKAEKSDTAPVERTDNRYDKRNSVYHCFHLRYFVFYLSTGLFSAVVRFFIHAKK